MLCDCYQYAKRHTWIGKPIRGGEGGREKEVDGMNVPKRFVVGYVLLF